MNASLCVRSNFSLADFHLTLGGGVRAGEARVSNFFSFDYRQVYDGVNHNLFLQILVYRLV